MSYQYDNGSGGYDPGPKKTKAIISLVCGILSLVFAWFGYSTLLGIVLGIVAIVTGSSARKELPREQAGMATAGMITGIIGLILCALMFVACVACVGLLGAAGAFSY